MDFTSLVLAVDSTQVNSASAALDKFAATGEKAEGATVILTKASADQAKVLGGALVPAAAKAAGTVGELADAEKRIGSPDTAARLDRLTARIRAQQKEALHNERLRIDAAAGNVTPQASSTAFKAKQGDGFASAQERAAASLAKASAEASNAQRATAALQAEQTKLAASTGAAATALADEAAQAAKAKSAVALKATASKPSTESQQSAANLAKTAKASADLETAQAKLARATQTASEAQAKLNQLLLVQGSIKPQAIADQRIRVQETRSAVNVAEARVQTAQARLIPPSSILASGAAAGRAAGQFDALGKSNKLAAFQNQQLAFQLNDFFVQVASGSNPMTALIQQGSQLSGTFGGVGNAIRAVVGLITPLRAVFAGAAAVGGVFALGAARSEQWARSLGDLQVALEAAGRAGQVSTAQLTASIDELAKAPGITRDAATQAVTELVRAGQVSSDLLADIVRGVPDFARAIGKDAPEAAKVLAQALSDPEAGAKKLEELLPRLSAKTRFLVRDLVNQGDTLKAQRTLFDDVARATAGLADRGLTPLQRAANELDKSWAGVMTTLRDSSGASAALNGLTSLVGGINALIQKADELRKKGIAPGVGSFTGIGALFQGARAAGELLNPTAEPGPRQRASGVVTNSAGQPVTALAVATQTTNTLEQQTKAALKLGEGYSSVSKEISGLVARQKTLKAALDANVKAGLGNSPEAKELRSQIEGVGERVASLRKRGAGPKARLDNEPNQVRQALLQADLRAFQDRLSDERDSLAFHNREIQALYQAGNTSLADFYDKRDKLAADGVKTQLATLAKERERLEAELKNPLVIKDKSEQEKIRGQIAEVDRDAIKAQIEADRAAKLSTLERAEAFKQLSEAVQEYRANLLQLEGNDSGAAGLRAQAQILQSRVLFNQSQQSANPITASEQDRNERAIENQKRLQIVQIETSRITERLAIEEERIALRLQTGRITETQALIQQGIERRKVVSLLEEQLAVQVSVFESNQDPQLLLNIERTRLELEKLKGALDPLKEKFDNLFKDAGANAIERFLNNPRDLKGAIKGFSEQILQTINRDISVEISGAIFGKDGVFGGVGGKLAEAFGGKRPEVDTSGVTTSLNTLTAQGIDPARAALDLLAQSANAAAGAVGQSGGLDSGFKFGDEPILNGQGNVFSGGLFSEVPSGEQSTLDLFRKPAADAVALGNALVDTRTNTEIFSDLLGPASMAVAGMGKEGTAAALALRLIPSIIQSLSASPASGGGLSSIFSTIVSAFTGGGQFGMSGSGGSFFNNGVRLHDGGIVGVSGTFFHDGGIVGQDKDVRPVHAGVFAGAPKYHDGGIVARAGKPGLAANEVPAILMGGPKGTREEVLTAKDQRHADNLSPAMRRIIDSPKQQQIIAYLSSIGGKGGEGGRGGDARQAFAYGGKGGNAFTQVGFNEGGYTGNKPEDKVAGVVHGREFVFSAPATKAIGVPYLKELHEAAKRGKTSLPGYRAGGPVGMTGSASLSARQQVTVNVVNNAGAKVQTRERQTPDGLVLDVLVDQVEASLIQRTGRGGGLDPLMSGRYGLNPGSNARR